MHEFNEKQFNKELVEYARDWGRARVTGALRVRDKAVARADKFRQRWLDAVQQLAEEVNRTNRLILENAALRDELKNSVSKDFLQKVGKVDAFEFEKGGPTYRIFEIEPAVDPADTTPPPAGARPTLKWEPWHPGSDSSEAKSGYYTLHTVVGQTGSDKGKHLGAVYLDDRDGETTSVIPGLSNAYATQEAAQLACEQAWIQHATDSATEF